MVNGETKEQVPKAPGEHAVGADLEGEGEEEADEEEVRQALSRPSFL